MVNSSSIAYQRMLDLVSSLSPSELEALKQIIRDRRLSAARSLRTIPQDF